MTRLEELIYALATVIVRYHDSQDNIEAKDKLVTAVDPTIHRKKSHDRAVEIIQNVSFASYLEGKISACTKGYHGREEFLLFLLNKICFLKEQLDIKTPFKEHELRAFQEQLTQLFIDFRKLLNIKKGVKHPVTLQDSRVKELAGLLNDRYIGSKYCNSGQLLIEEVLFVLHMTPDDSNEELKDIAANICLEQQTLLQWQSEASKKSTKESDREAEKLELEQLKLLMATQKSEFENKIVELSEKEKQQLITIDELTLKLEKIQAEYESLKKQTEEAPTRRFQVYPPLYGYGLAGLPMLQRQGGNSSRFFSQTMQTPPTSSQTLPTLDDFEENPPRVTIE
ncbi:hypothetical protein [Legionella sp. PC997]|uniref:hypothetical protein n=1 Tax=Legionella sp. PC997 TaxID=2755562 RepID=UPI0015FADB44|nr:hypothetical protein [Legionella sp. PC997]QMT59643.1 hypothetical protein HBNCFIEN_01009 [Legionella sp. PC997]